MDFESPENESTTAGNQARINIKWTTGTLKLKRHPGGAGVLLSQAFCFFSDNRRKISLPPFPYVGYIPYVRDILYSLVLVDEDDIVLVDEDDIV